MKTAVKVALAIPFALAAGIFAAESIKIEREVTASIDGITHTSCNNEFYDTPCAPNQSMKTYAHLSTGQVIAVDQLLANHEFSQLIDQGRAIAAETGKLTQYQVRYEQSLLDFLRPSSGNGTNAFYAKELKLLS